MRPNAPARSPRNGPMERQAVLLGMVAFADGVRAAIGVTGQFSAVDDLFTGEENLRLMADLNHLGRVAGRRRVADLLDAFDLVEAARKPVTTYSGGMRRRLDLAMTLVGSPRVILLDEPHGRPGSDVVEFDVKGIGGQGIGVLRNRVAGR
jgi:ABC-type multidrug transport system ATPase subunit